MASKRRIKKTVVPVVDTSAYTAGDNIGGKLTFQASSGNAHFSLGSIRGIYIGDADSEESAIDVVIFDEDPTATTFTDQAALAIADADLPKIIHVENLTAYDTFSNNSVSGAVSLAVSIDPSDVLYVALVARGTPTYTAATDLDVTIVIEVEG